MPVFFVFRYARAQVRINVGGGEKNSHGGLFATLAREHDCRLAVSSTTIHICPVAQQNTNCLNDALLCGSHQRCEPHGVGEVYVGTQLDEKTESLSSSVRRRKSDGRRPARGSSVDVNSRVIRTSQVSQQNYDTEWWSEVLVSP